MTKICLNLSKIFYTEMIIFAILSYFMQINNYILPILKKVFIFPLLFFQFFYTKLCYTELIIKSAKHSTVYENPEILKPTPPNRKIWGCFVLLKYRKGGTSNKVESPLNKILINQLLYSNNTH